MGFFALTPLGIFGGSGGGSGGGSTSQVTNNVTNNTYHQYYTPPGQGERNFVPYHAKSISDAQEGLFLLLTNYVRDLRGDKSSGQSSSPGAPQGHPLSSQERNSGNSFVQAGADNIIGHMLAVGLNDLFKLRHEEDMNIRKEEYNQKMSTWMQEYKKNGSNSSSMTPPPTMDLTNVVPSYSIGGSSIGLGSLGGNSSGSLGERFNGLIDSRSGSLSSI